MSPVKKSLLGAVAALILWAFSAEKAQADWQLWVANEIGLYHPRSDSLFNPQESFFAVNRTSNDLLISGWMSCKIWEDRLRFQASASNRWTAQGKSQDRLLLKEAFAVVSLNGQWDLTLGKKILKWGTGYAFNPTGFADPPKDPRDPKDRLELNQGVELIQADYVRGSHAVNLVYFAPRLYFTGESIRARDRLAVRYNRVWKGLDFSVMALVPSQTRKRAGANFSYVVGRSLEVHGELALERFTRNSTERFDLPPSAGQNQSASFLQLQWLANPSGAVIPAGPSLGAKAVFGLNYTHSSGWTLIAEIYHAGNGWSPSESRIFYREVNLLSHDALLAGGISRIATNPALVSLLSTLQQLPVVRQSQNNLFFMGSRTWGYDRYSFQTVVLTNLSDHSTAVIPQLSYMPRRHWQLYLRNSFFLGKRESEYGSLIYDSISNLGLRYNF